MLGESPHDIHQLQRGAGCLFGLGDELRLGRFRALPCGVGSQFGGQLGFGLFADTLARRGRCWTEADLLAEDDARELRVRVVDDVAPHS